MKSGKSTRSKSMEAFIIYLLIMVILLPVVGFAAGALYQRNKNNKIENEETTVTLSPTPTSTPDSTITATPTNSPTPTTLKQNQAYSTARIISVNGNTVVIHPLIKVDPESDDYEAHCSEDETKCPNGYTTDPDKKRQTLFIDAKTTIQTVMDEAQNCDFSDQKVFVYESITRLRTSFCGYIGEKGYPFEIIYDTVSNKIITLRQVHISINE